jgi:hypothetical protein
MFPRFQFSRLRPSPPAAKKKTHILASLLLISMWVVIQVVYTTANLMDTRMI